MQLAEVRFVALRRTRYLNVPHLAAGQVVAQFVQHIAFHNLAVVEVELHFQVVHADGVNDGMRIGLALTVIGVIATEMLSSLDGVGFLISYNRSMFNTAHVYLGILLALLCAWGVNRGLTAIERRFSAWRTDAQG